MRRRRSTKHIVFKIHRLSQVFCLRETDKQIAEHAKLQDLPGIDFANVSVDELQDLSVFEFARSSFVDKVSFTETDVPAFGMHVSRSKQQQHQQATATASIVSVDVSGIWQQQQQ